MFVLDVIRMKSHTCTNLFRHHDFIIPETHDLYQASRFATILLYLNDEGLKGGETSFPRWLNGETRNILHVKPKVGKAVLFYNQLPDGNYDERSQHAAKPVIEGEKWLVRTTHVINLFENLAQAQKHLSLHNPNFTILYLTRIMIFRFHIQSIFRKTNFWVWDPYYKH